MSSTLPSKPQDDIIAQRQKELERRQFLEQEKAKNEALLAKLDKAAQRAKQQQNNTDPLQQMVVDVEKDLLFQIMLHLRESKLSRQQAQQLAKDFLALLPVQDKKDLLNKLYTLGQQNMEAKEVYVKYAQPILEEERLKKLQEMSLHIKSGNI